VIDLGIMEKIAKRTRFCGDWYESEEELDKLKGRVGDYLDLARCVWPTEHKLPDHITKACEKVIARKPEYRFFGLLELMEAIAEKLERENGIEVNPKTQVLVTTGAAEAIFLAIFSFIESNDEFIMGDPGYLPGYEPNVLMAGGRVVHIQAKEERNFELDPEDIEKGITRRTKIINITTPENPTGAVMQKSDLEVIAEIAKKHDLVVLSNEVYGKLVYDGRKHVSIASLPGMEKRTLTINGFSKSFDMHGFRVGYIVGPEEVIRRMKNIQSHITVSVNDVGQYAALAALTGPQDWIKNAVKQFEKRRNLLVEGLNRIDGIKCNSPEGGHYVFPNIKAFGMPSSEFAKYLLQKAKVWVFPGSDFGIYGEGYLRISFMRPEKVIKEALKRIKMAVEDLQ